MLPFFNNPRKIVGWLRPGILGVLISMVLLPAYGQDSYPPAYRQLTTDTARMRFLVKAIADSLDEDQLTRVYEWSLNGLAMAERNKVDTMKGIFHYFIGKAFTYKYQKPDSAIVHYKQVLPYFTDKMRKYNVFSLREIMEGYSEMGNKDSTFVYLDSLNALIDTMPETAPKRVSLSQNIATVYQWFGMFRSAIRYYQVAINGDRKNGNRRGLGLALANLGELYAASADDDKAILYSKEALDYLWDVNRPYVQTAANIATYYTNQRQFDSALRYVQKSEAMSRRIGDSGQLITLQGIMADIYIQQGKYTTARELLQQNLSAQTAAEDSWGLLKTHFSFAMLDTNLHQYASAKTHLLQVLTLARQTEQQIQVVLALQSLAAVSARLKDYKGAFDYQQQFLLHQDSLSNEKTKASLADLEISYKTTQKEQQIQLLQKDNDIKSLELQNSRRSAFFYTAAFIMVLTILGIFFYQRNLRNKAETRHIKAELETKVLRLQMNPHFIFNSLNSIENFIMHNEKRLASDYLNKFARLIRMILDSSRHEVVPVAKDMEALQLYVDLEQLRFSHKFSYHTYIDPALLGGDYRTPSLLIQPYVENAIIHGLAHSEENDLQLTVTATLEEDKIKYTVQDNGIGRRKSGEYNRQNKPNHQSIGLQTTEDRIHIFNKQASGQRAVCITDLYDEQQNPDGTKVEITINAV